MKLRHVVFSIALLLLASIPAFSQEWMRLTRYRDGYRYTFKLTEEEIQKLPSWNPETADVPLSAHKAVEIAQSNLKRLMPKTTEKWRLDGVNLSRMGMGKDKWIYEIEFLAEEIRMDSDISFTIFVKMDGTIVEPEIVPDDGKSRVY
ncbi:MAG TPA: hypothetical protein VE732_09130 [Nitrososphaera sp.]|nr:hypothetical protein [Nitrososphaera sp.]